MHGTCFKEAVKSENICGHRVDQSSLHCSTMVEESGEMRACAAHRAEHPIRYLRVVPEPIGSLQPRLKIDNCRGEQQGEKAL